MTLEKEEAQAVFDKIAIKAAIEAADLLEKEVRVFLDAYEKIRKQRRNEDGEAYRDDRTPIR